VNAAFPVAVAIGIGIPLWRSPFAAVLAAFAIYAVRYWPVLSPARLDGKPG
jgi:hypothetical protein